MKKLKDFERELNKCSKCGLCQSACPLFKINPNDCIASKGKFIMLHGVTKGDLKLTKNINKYLDLCLKCGKCCRYMYSFDTYTTTDFKIMQFLFPAYRRFYIRGKDEDGNLIFACKYVTDEGLCSVYEKRLKMCRNYPAKKIKYPGKLHKGCGYTVENKSFESYLNK